MKSLVVLFAAAVTAGAVTITSSSVNCGDVSGATNCSVPNTTGATTPSGEPIYELAYVNANASANLGAQLEFSATVSGDMAVLDSVPLPDWSAEAMFASLVRASGPSRPGLLKMTYSFDDATGGYAFLSFSSREFDIFGTSSCTTGTMPYLCVDSFTRAVTLGEDEDFLFTGRTSLSVADGGRFYDHPVVRWNWATARITAQFFEADGVTPVQMLDSPGSGDPSEIPEPGSAALLLSGIGFLAWRGRRSVTL